MTTGSSGGFAAAIGEAGRSEPEATTVGGGQSPLRV
jgi:hypothetical protein